MAARRVVGTFFSVFLLCCWQGLEPQPLKGTSGPVTEEALNSTAENMPEVFDEILSQEILETNKSTVPETVKTTKPSTTTKQASNKTTSIDDNYQEGGSENYHELLDNLELSSVNKESIDNDDRSTVDNSNTNGPENKLELQSFEDKKSSNSDKYRKLSVLDKILQNIGRSEDNLGLTGNIF